MAYKKIVELESLEDGMNYADAIASIDKMLLETDPDEVKRQFKVWEMRIAQKLRKAICEKESVNEDSKEWKENLKRAEDQLNKVKKWLALDVESLTFATISSIAGRTIAQIEKPILILTEEQKAEYASCLAVGNGPYWFTALSPIEQKLVLSYKEDIIRGRVIPSQLRNKLPGIKNAYCHVAEEVTIPADGSEVIAEPITQYYHCGTIVHLDNLNADNEISQSSRDITEMNARQQSLAGALIDGTSDLPHTTVMVTLNSRYADRALGFFHKLRRKPYYGEDERIVKQTEEVKVEGFVSSNVCLNMLRLVERANSDGIKCIYNNVTSLFQAIYSDDIFQRLKNPTTKTFLTDGKLRLTYNKHGEKIPEEIVEQLIQLRYLASECRSLVEKERRVKHDFDKNVNGLRMVSLTSQIADLSNKIARNYERREDLQAANVSTMGVFFGCASGNNRTGFQEFENNFSALRTWARQNDLAVSDEELQSALANSQHMQLIKGFQGGDFGLDGIRSKSKGTAPRTYPVEVVNSLVTEWSDVKTAEQVTVGSHAQQQKIDQLVEQRKQMQARKPPADQSSISGASSHRS